MRYETAKLGMLSDISNNVFAHHTCENCEIKFLLLTANNCNELWLAGCSNYAKSV
jgi:hypothetical protein